MIKIEWSENKSPDWKVCTVVNEIGATIENVSVNRKNKKNEIFPNFDGIVPGAEIEGEMWQSPAGKWYLFAPKVKGQGMGPRPAYAPKKPDMGKMIEKKQEGIATAQENKAEGIKISSTIRMAVDIAICERTQKENTLYTLEDRIKYWREYLWTNWDVSEKDMPPF